MVMKSRVSDQASMPSVGTFSMPTLSFGSGSSPAGPAISRAASTIARCDPSCDDFATASRIASASDSASSAARAGSRDDGGRQRGGQRDGDAAAGAARATAADSGPRADADRCGNGRHATSTNALNGPARARAPASGNRGDQIRRRPNCRISGGARPGATRCDGVRGDGRGEVGERDRRHRQGRERGRRKVECRHRSGGVGAVHFAQVRRRQRRRPRRGRRSGCAATAASATDTAGRARRRTRRRRAHACAVTANWAKAMPRMPSQATMRRIGRWSWCNGRCYAVPPAATRRGA